MEVRIRRARVSEIDTVVELWDELIQTHSKFEPRIKLSTNYKEEYKNYISYHCIRPESLLIIAEVGDKVVGYCLAYKMENLPMFKPSYLGYISDVSITEKYKGKGIGSLLVSKVKEWLKMENIHILHIQVYDNNEEGVNFWRKMGFKDFFTRMQLDF